MQLSRVCVCVCVCDAIDKVPVPFVRHVAGINMTCVSRKPVVCASVHI